MQMACSGSVCQFGSPGFLFKIVVGKDNAGPATEALRK